MYFIVTRSCGVLVYVLPDSARISSLFVRFQICVMPSCRVPLVDKMCNISPDYMVEGCFSLLFFTF